MAIDVNNLQWGYRSTAGGGSERKNSYSFTYTDPSSNQSYTFVPDSVVNTGVKGTSDNQYVFPWFLNKENLGTLGKNSQKVDFAGTADGSYYTDDIGSSTTGFLFPTGTVPFDSEVRTFQKSQGEVKGIAEKDGELVYTQSAGGNQVRYLNSEGTIRTTTYTPGRSWLGETFGGIGDAVADFVNSDIGKLALVAAAAYAGGAFDPSSAAATAGEVAGSEAALVAAEGAGLTATEGGLLSGSVGSSGTGLTAGASGAGLTATQGAGTTLFADAAGAGGLGLTGGSAANLAAMGGASGLTTAAAGGGVLGALGVGTGTAATLGGIGAGIGASTLASGTGSLLGTGAAAGGAAAAGGLSNAALIQGGLQLAGGLLGGQSAIDAQRDQAAQQAALAEKVSAMGKFQPVGTTTRFGTSSFVTDPVTGAITPSYSLTPEAQAYQTSLAALGTQGLEAGQGLMNLGQQYIGESPEAVRQRYIQTQRATLAPEQEQQLARIRNGLFQTGRTGVATGATTAGGLAATNPEMAAYYNSLANTERMLAANAETQYQNQVNFGAGLLGGATTPFTNVFGAQKAVETAGQQPLGLSTDFANTVAIRGAAQGANYAAAMNPSINNTAAANSYNPFATTLQGAASNPLLAYGLSKLT